MTRLSLSEARALAGSHFAAGRFAECRAVVDAILAVEPDCAVALQLRGLLAQREGRPDEALADLRRAADLAPDKADVFDNLCVCLATLRRYDEAETAARRALALRPDFAGAASNLGNVLRAVRRLDEAEAAYRRAIALQADAPDAHLNLSALLFAEQRFAEAASVAQAAVARNPRRMDLRLNLAGALNQLGRLTEAEEAYRAALALDPHAAALWHDLAATLMHAGRVEEAIAAESQAVELAPAAPAFHSGLLLALQYKPGVTPVELYEAHLEWDRRHAWPLRDSRPRCSNDPRADRPLRVGFVSAEFGQHPVGRFLVRLLECLDRREITAVCYSDRPRDDAIGRRIRAAAEWIDIEQQTDAELAERIAADRIDLLFDLAGHTPRNRLLAFARKPAPVQVAWIGYPGTTGLGSIDFLLADGQQTPHGAERFYRERILRMPDAYVCYDPPSDAPDVGPLPALRNGYFTFGSLNNLAKIQAPVIELWAEILRRVPDARMVLQYNGLDDAATRGRYARAFEHAGVAADRIAMFGFSSPREVLFRYQEIDLALDPFPYSGGLTTCEALWMGVPVLTCPGETFAGRHALAHLTAAGLAGTIARDHREYGELAVRWSGDASQLANLRAGLRDQVRQSPLCDGPRFARNFAAAMREAWAARSSSR